MVRSEVGCRHNPFGLLLDSFQPFGPLPCSVNVALQLLPLGGEGADQPSHLGPITILVIVVAFFLIVKKQLQPLDIHALGHGLAISFLKNSCAHFTEHKDTLW